MEYFNNFNLVTKLRNGRRKMLIGWKGTGKTRYFKEMYDPIILHIPAEKRKELIAREWKEDCFAR